MDERSRTAAQLLGDAAEALVARRLEAGGWRVLGRNVRVGRLELDLVGVDPGPPPALVIVEVRWRARRDYGLAEETVDFRKRARLRAAAFTLLDRDLIDDVRLPKLPLRIDLVVVEPAPGVGEEPRVRHHRGIG
ncbi:MAG TPA: YraN family protein [Candidatus Limnocylindrales bacterium]|nr:YraN family protein [Candidatus Limnocylindrales bacterium]